MRPIDPLGPLSQSSGGRPRGLRWPYLVLIVVLGCLLMWILLARANAPEEGGIREGRAARVPVR